MEEACVGSEPGLTVGGTPSVKLDWKLRKVTVTGEPYKRIISVTAEQVSYIIQLQDLCIEPAGIFFTKDG